MNTSFKNLFSKKFTTRKPLIAGMIAGVLVMTLSYAIAYLSDGFNISRHANSSLVLGEWGWLQTINFITLGILVTIASIGARDVMRGKPGGTWGPLLMMVYGIGGIIIGLAPTDPGFGFPPGSDPTFQGYGAASLSAQIHGIAGGIAFTAMAIACLVFARYFYAAKHYTWTGLSVVAGLSVFGVTAYLVISAGRELDSFNYLPTWIVGSLLWLYVSLVSWKLHQEASPKNQQ